MTMYRFNDGAQHPPGDADVALAAWLACVSRANCVGGVCLYDRDEASSTVASTEREIYCPAPGDQRYLIVLESTRRAPWESADWRELEASLPPAQLPTAVTADLTRQGYWLEFVQYPPR